MILLWEKHNADAMFGMSKSSGFFFNRLYDVGAIIPESALSTIKSSKNIVYVKSAFSGFGLYRTSSIRKYSARYDVPYPNHVRSSKNNMGQIEHIPFNLHFKKVLVYPLFNPIY